MINDKHDKTSFFTGNEIVALSVSLLIFAATFAAYCYYEVLAVDIDGINRAFYPIGLVLSACITIATVIRARRRHTHRSK